LFNNLIIFSVLASSGIDNDVKLWYPLLSEPSFNQDKAKEVGKQKTLG